jgi:itaconate CoA-transferase
VPFGAINDLDQVLRHPQLAARDRWVDVASPVGLVSGLHHPMNISDLPRPLGAVPAQGEHTAEVLAELRLDAD